MNALRDATNAVWAMVVGVIGLFCFFALVGAFDPGEVAWLTATVAVLAILAAVHFGRVRHALDREHGGELARSVHAMRERRGF